MFLQDKLMWLLAFHKKEMKSCTKSYKTNSSRWHKCLDIQASLLKRTTAMVSTSGQGGFLHGQLVYNYLIEFFSLHAKQNSTFVFEVEEENRKSRKTWTHNFILSTKNNQAPAPSVTEMPVTQLLKQIPFLLLDIPSHPQYPEPLQTPTAAGSSARDDPGGLKHQFWLC